MRHETERVILGALFLGGGAFDSKAFKDKRHRLIFKAMWKVKASYKDVNLVTVKEELQRKGKLEKAGGVVYLTSLVDGI